jgi:hypothetical protein
LDYYLYADELLKAGTTGHSIELLVELKKLLAASAIKRGTLDDYKINKLLALSYMRLGEQSNCIDNHCSESCVFPIKGHGMHKQISGSENAKKVLLDILKDHPDDFESIWLLNIAYMTLNEFPDKVPVKFRIPATSLSSEYPLPHFRDIAGKLKMDVNGLSGGVCMEDFNNDGNLDLFISETSYDKDMHFFANLGNGTFEDQTNQAGLKGLMGGLNIIHADYNNDGYEDIFVLRGGWYGESGRIPNSLLKNNGDGTFSDVTMEAGLLSYHPTQTGSWGDFNNDGWIDLFIGNETTLVEHDHACELYLNNKNGSFTNVARQMGLDFKGYVKGCVWTDVNNDGLQDLFISARAANDRKAFPGNNKLYINKGGADIQSWSFEDFSVRAKIELPHVSFAVGAWDYDNDGYDDIMVNDFGTTKGTIAAEVASEFFGLPHSTELMRFYHNTAGRGFTDEGKYFQDVTYAGGFGNLQKGHGVAFGDIDNDGDQDIFLVTGGAVGGDVFKSSLFENPGSKNKWVTLKLEGVKSNRSAIGARIKISVISNGTGRTIYNRVSTGASFGSSSLQQEIGLGQAERIEEIEVIWPTTGITQKFHNIEMNKFYKIKEDVNELIPFDLQKISL